jgi:hypothetical protein
MDLNFVYSICKFGFHHLIKEYWIEKFIKKNDFYENLNLIINQISILFILKIIR